LLAVKIPSALAELAKKYQPIEMMKNNFVYRENDTKTTKETSSNKKQA